MERPGSRPEGRARHPRGEQRRARRNRGKPDPPEPDQHLQGQPRRFQAGTPDLRRTNPARHPGPSGFQGIPGSTAENQGGMDRGGLSRRPPRGAPLERSPHDFLFQRHQECQEPAGVSARRMATQGDHQRTGNHRGAPAVTLVEPAAIVVPQQPPIRVKGFGPRGTPSCDSRGRTEGGLANCGHPARSGRGIDGQPVASYSLWHSSGRCCRVNAGSIWNELSPSLPRG